MLRCSENRLLLLFYYLALLSGGFISFWHTIYLRRVLRCRGDSFAAAGRASRWGGCGPLPQGLRHQPAQIFVRRKGSEARNCRGIGKIPLVFGNTNKVTNGGIGRP